MGTNLGSAYKASHFMNVQPRKFAGDVDGIQLREIAQTHFLPLLDIVCGAVVRLNGSGKVVTPVTLRKEIEETCPPASVPSMRILQQALQTLHMQGILDVNGGQICISMPPSAPYHPLKIPSTRTVPCQTGKSIIDEEEIRGKSKIKRGWHDFILRSTK